MGTIDEFMRFSQIWFEKVESVDKEEYNVAISFELEPIANYKSFKNRKVTMTTEKQWSVTKARLIYNNMLDLKKLMDYLKNKIDLSNPEIKSEYVALEKLRYDLIKNIFDFENAINSREFTDGIFKAFEKNSVSDFLGTELYKNLSKKLKKEPTV